ncbi:hypothetical protein BU14_0164s0012 [Porphyra umbilicalis]|uniref:H15 domain-containing protein n=1 Tax=Porphyra umbilicalis TaxID=2786 RepID=A0A1X6P835_PORUM|nr:hypothetical protein BU14_0164s0012 [Porphyra umbilicalis]|eukprot:OSX77051.1 hypothetical protein BU14_0164s0012 [Porphyra umbilicalis]
MATKAKSAVAKKSHPTYSVMTAEAVKALKERSGSSLPAVTKYITTTYAIDVNKYALNKALRDGVSDGKLIKIKASYKLPATVKEAAPKKKKAAPAAAAAKAAPKKKTVKKAAPPAATKTKRAAPTKAKAPTKKAASTGPKKAITKKTKSATTKSPRKAKASK